jgi:hypothetical protein
VTHLHHSLFALEPQHGPSFSLSLLMQVHVAAAVVESGGDAGDAVAIRRRLCGGEGPVRVLGGGGLAETPVHRRAQRVWHPLPYRSATRLTRLGLLAVGVTLQSLFQRPRAPHA